MTKLILHVGPPKCGSSSIQFFFTVQQDPCVQKTRFVLLDPLEITELNDEKPGKSITISFARQLSDHLFDCDALILSHEYLFECPYAIQNICHLAKNAATEIYIVGYARRQFDYFVSAYSQWSFRSPGVLNDAISVLDTLGLEPSLFSGLERQLIYFAANDFDFSHPGLLGYKNFDWYSSYTHISRLVSASEAVIKSGILPNKEADTSLIQDFCEKSGLTLRAEMKEASRLVLNKSFHPDLVEAIANGVVFGLDMPRLHEGNELLELFSSQLTQLPIPSSEFMCHIKWYIDTYFSSSNQRFCREYGLPETEFVPQVLISKPEIMDIIMAEGQQRALNKSLIIDNYRLLSARMIELCLKVVDARQEQ